MPCMTETDAPKSAAAASPRSPLEAERDARDRARRRAFWARMTWLAAGLGAWNVLFFAAHLWFSLWWLGLFGNFVLAVLIAERVSHVVPLGRRSLYEGMLAFGFPAMALVAWQLIVDAGILSATWFPQPTRIAQALWDFNDGLPSADAETAHTYPKPGEYRVTLVVWDGSGRGARAEKRIRIEP